MFDPITGLFFFIIPALGLFFTILFANETSVRLVAFVCLLGFTGLLVQDRDQQSEIQDLKSKIAELQREKN